MSQSRNEARATNVPPNAEFAMGDDQHLPQWAQNQASQPEGQSDFVDGSGPIFSMYMEMAEEEDKKLAESWKADADSILVFTGLFSAAVATLLSVSIQDLQQNPQDTSNFYLANIYQATVDPNRSSSLPASPPPFSTPGYAVWVNGLWFMSLVISITCAVLATLLQQWARRYLKVTATQTRYGLHKRAKIRTFFAEGVQESWLPHVVEALPTLIHVSLVLFFAGLAVFLWNVNLTIFKVVLSWVGVCTALYGYTMFISIVRHNSPYSTPLTPLALLVICVIGIVPAFYLRSGYGILALIWTKFLGGPQYERALKMELRLFRFLKMTLLAPENTALLKSPPELDARALMWTFGRLDEDHELVRFFSGLPGFHSSKFLKEPLRGLTDDQKLELLAAMIGFLDRTYSSDLLSDRIKRQREDICGNAIDLVDTPKAYRQIVRGLANWDNDPSLMDPVATFQGLMMKTMSVRAENESRSELLSSNTGWSRSYNQHSLAPVQSTEILQFVRRLGNRKGEDTTPVIKAIFSIAVARVNRHDDAWFILASDELAIPEATLRLHAAYGNSLSLAILIHIIRQQFIYFRTPSWPSWEVSRVLKSASTFDVQDTSPELQHEFCALWNQIVRKAQDDNDREIAWRTLDSFRRIYIALHQGTDSVPTNFPAVTYSPASLSLTDRSMYPLCHVPSHILSESAPTTFPRTIQQHDNAALAIDPLTSPDSPFVSAPTPPHVDKNPAAVPPLDNSHYTHQPVDSLYISLTSLDPSDAGAIQDIVASEITASYPTPEASTSPPRSSTSPPAAVSLQDMEDLLTPPDSPNLPSPAPGLDLNNTLPIESRQLITVPGAPIASLVQAPSPDPDTVAVEDGSPISSSCKEEHDLDCSVHHAIDANTTPTMFLTPQPPSLPSVTEPDGAMVGRSQRVLDAEHEGAHPLDSSSYRYDMV